MFGNQASSVGLSARCWYDLLFHFDSYWNRHQDFRLVSDRNRHLLRQFFPRWLHILQQVIFWQPLQDKFFESNHHIFVLDDKAAPRI